MAARIAVLLPLCVASPTALDIRILLPTDLASMHGVQWRKEPPTVSKEPLLLPETAWDGGGVGPGGAGTVLYDKKDSLYKLWYLATPALSSASFSPQSPDNGRLLCYAFSKDGVT